MVRVRVSYFEITNINDPEIIREYLISKGIDPSKQVTMIDDFEKQEVLIIQK